ncbi:MAG: hypothetical protein WDO18_08855 [Acidobacteriota bacterium]
MRTVFYRRWAPAKSAVKIEFMPDVLHDIRAEARGHHDRGYLFGKHGGNEVRVLAAIRAPQENDPRVTQMEPVGIYISRSRGEIFLTDEDLEQAETVPDGIILVVAGSRAGFFSWESDGTMQAVRSHEEFTVADAAAYPESPQPLLKLPRAHAWRHPGLPPVSFWKVALGIGAMLAGPATALTYLQPRMTLPPIEMSLRETNGQLLIAWDPKMLPDGGHLNISEGDMQTSLPLGKYGSGITYMAQSGDVEIRLTAGQRTGAVHWRSARYR